MGRHTDQVIISAASAKDAYRIACDDHYNDREPGSLSGGLSTIVSTIATPRTAENYLPSAEIADEDAVVPVTNDFVETTRTVTVSLPGEDYLRLRIYDATAITHFLGMKDAVSAEVTKSPRLPKPKAVVTEGDMRRVYEVHVARNYNTFTKSHQYFPTKGEYESVAEARAAAVKIMESGKYVSASVRGRMVRDTEDLVVVSAPAPEKVSLTLSVTEQKASRGAKADGYLVRYWVHS